MEQQKPVLLSDILIPGVLTQKTSHMKQILRDFLDNDVVSIERLRDACYPVDGKGPPLWMDTTIRVRLCRLRYLLKPGWEIVSYRQGIWRLVKNPKTYAHQNSTPAGRAFLRRKQKEVQWVKQQQKVD